jgi:hypothetical protein
MVIGFSLGYCRLLFRIPSDLLECWMTRALTKIQNRGDHPMSFQDKPIHCSDCQTAFTFNAGEQEFFASKGFTDEPKRCPSCRTKRKMERHGDGDYSYRSRAWR